MPFMIWSESLSVGIPSIDAQHATLIHLINALNEDRLQGDARQAVRSTLDHLLEYALEHFRYEEELLERTGYPGAAAHVGEHQQFLGRLRAMQATLQSNAVPSALELMDFMIEWLNNHMVGSDKDYSKHLLAAGIS